MASEGMSFPRIQANPTYKSRFLTLRFNKAVKQFSPIQRGHVIKYKLEALLHMPDHLKIPMNLLEWLDIHMFSRDSCFRHKYKVIKVTKEMVDLIFDFPGGTVPFVDSSNDPEVKAEVAVLRSKYLDARGKIPLKKIEEVMLSDQTEEGFIRSFVFFFIATILCPTSYNFANPRYLYSLRDVSQIPMLDFSSLCLDFMFEESSNHSDMIFNRPTLEEINKPSYIGGCLPVWAIIYMDFVDFNHIPNNQSIIDYSLPRISHIKNEDFEYLALVDKNYKSRKAYGVLPQRHISLTPYATIVPNNLNNDPAPQTPNVPINLNTLNNNSAVPKTSPEPQVTPVYHSEQVDVKLKVENNVKAEPVLNNLNNASAFQTSNVPINLNVLNINSSAQKTFPEPQITPVNHSKQEDVKAKVEINLQAETAPVIHSEQEAIKKRWKTMRIAAKREFMHKAVVL